MKDGGYETHMIGKWHLGSYDQPYIPSERGFDTYLGYLEGQGTYWTHQVTWCYACTLSGSALGLKQRVKRTPHAAVTPPVMLCSGKELGLSAGQSNSFGCRRKS